MKYPYSSRSLRQLDTCDDRFKVLLTQVAEYIDTTIIQGHRSNEQQEELYRAGKSQLRAGQSKHNVTPSLAVDIAPFPIDWNDRERFTLFAGFVMGLATSRRIVLRWGGDWNRNWYVRDNNFDDLVHFELVD